MNELNYLGEALNKATLKGAFDLNETNQIARCLTAVKTALDKKEETETAKDF